jgi:anti-anti-sigma factor
MKIQTEPISSSQVVIRPSGRMDVESSPEVRQAILEQAVPGVESVVIDLQSVDFMDSSGLSALVSGMKALKKNGGRLAICNTNPQVRTALRLTMLERVIPAYDSVEQALKEPGGQSEGPG